MIIWRRQSSNRADDDTINRTLWRMCNYHLFYIFVCGLLTQHLWHFLMYLFTFLSIFFHLNVGFGFCGLRLLDSRRIASLVLVGYLLTLFQGDRKNTTLLALSQKFNWFIKISKNIFIHYRLYKGLYTVHLCLSDCTRFDVQNVSNRDSQKTQIAINIKYFSTVVTN